MKKKLLVIFIFLFCFSAYNSLAKLKKSNPNPPQAVARGFSNLMFGWLEVPRGIIYENSRIPIVGLVVGPIKGTLLTAWRVVAGTVDVVGMGLTREGLYSDSVLPEYVWDAPWISPCGEDFIDVKTINTSSCSTEYVNQKKSIEKKCRVIATKKIERKSNKKRQTSCKSKGKSKNYKKTVLCWDTPSKSSHKKRKLNKRKVSVKSNSKTPVPFNLNSDDEFLKALDQIKHHVKNIEHRAQLISK